MLFLIVGFSGVANSDGIEDGQNYVMATHSFNIFIGPRTNRQTGSSSAGPLAALAKESGKMGHQNLAVQMIGGSTPMQHWNQGEGDEGTLFMKLGKPAASNRLLTWAASSLVANSPA